MGRKKIDQEDKKQNVSITLTPKLIQFFQKKHINLSSLVNHLLTNYVKNGEKNL